MEKTEFVRNYVRSAKPDVVIDYRLLSVKFRMVVNPKTEEESEEYTRILFDEYCAEWGMIPTYYGWQIMVKSRNRPYLKPVRIESLSEMTGLEAERLMKLASVSNLAKYRMYCYEE